MRKRNCGPTVHVGPILPTFLRSPRTAPFPASVAHPDLVVSAQLWVIYPHLTRFKRQAPESADPRESQPEGLESGRALCLSFQRGARRRAELSSLVQNHR